MISISWGVDVRDKNPTKSLSDTLELWGLAEDYKQAIEKSRDAQGRLRTLFVISAGNDTSDTFWSGWGYLRRDPRYANNIIIVGAAGRSGTNLTMTYGTNGGQDVDIVAPGEKVGVVDIEYPTPLSDKVVLKTGSSFAAPFVAGLAAMLLTNDSTLTPDSLKKLIIAGANVKPRPIMDPFDAARPKPFLDAYESLRLLSTNQNAPLCGNRVWNDGNNNILAERGNSTTELLFDRPASDYAAFTNPFHGGRRIEVGFSYQYKYSPLAPYWTPDGYVEAPDSAFGGAYLSYTYGSDHDNKKWTTRFDTADASGQEMRITLVNAGSRTLIADFGSRHVPFTDPTPPRVCILEYPVNGNGPSPFVYAQEFLGKVCQGYAIAGAWNSLSNPYEVDNCSASEHSDLSTPV